MIYEPQDFSHLVGLKGLSKELLETHFKLYEGYVENTNKLLEEISKTAAAEEAAKFPQSELRRRFGWEFDGMRLHEYYFGNLTNDPRPINRESKLYAKITEDFGSFEDWEKDFRNMGKIRGMGWVILYYDYEAERLLNVWVGEHHVGHLAGTDPILAMDVWEHAYMKDYGTDRASYIEAFFNNIDWEEVEARFEG